MGVFCILIVVLTIQTHTCGKNWIESNTCTCSHTCVHMQMRGSKAGRFWISWVVCINVNFQAQFRRRLQGGIWVKRAHRISLFLTAAGETTIISRVKLKHAIAYNSWSDPNPDTHSIKRWWGWGVTRTLANCPQECKDTLKDIWEFLTKLNMLWSYDPAVTPHYLSKGVENWCHTKTCTQIFWATSLIVAKAWRPPRCPSVESKQRVAQPERGALFGTKRNELSSHEKT